MELKTTAQPRWVLPLLLLLRLVVGWLHYANRLKSICQFCEKIEHEPHKPCIRTRMPQFFLCHAILFCFPFHISKLYCCFSCSFLVYCLYLTDQWFHFGCYSCFCSSSFLVLMLVGLSLISIFRIESGCIGNGGFICEIRQWY